MAQFSTIAAITGSGRVLAVDLKGNSRVLKVGDSLEKGETVRTIGDVRVELLMEDGRVLAVLPEQSIRLDENVVESDQRPTAQDSAVTTPATAETIIQALERGGDLSVELEAAAAGLAAGGAVDGGSSFVQLLRIVEGVEPLSYNYAYKATDIPPDVRATGAPAPTVVTPPEPVVVGQTMLVEEESVPAKGGGVIGIDEPEGNAHAASGAVWSGGASGVVTTITIAGFAPVTVAAGGSTVFFDQNGQPIPATDQETVAVAQLTVKPDGSYAFEMLGAMSHEAGAGENTLDIPTVVLSGTASDGAPTTLNLTLSVQDDVPLVTAGVMEDQGVALSTADANTIGEASDTASASFADAFLAAATPSYGADGEGSTVISGYTLTLNGEEDVASGLYSAGEEIMLNQEGEDVVGSTDAGEIFRISVDSSGNVTLSQSAQIDHVEGTSEDDVIALADGLVTLSATATTTDADGDTATATVSADLGGNLSFVDDQPVITSASDIVTYNASGYGGTGTFVAEIGADSSGGYQFTGFVDGDQGTVAGGGMMTANGGSPVYLFGAGTNVLEGKLSADGTGASVFTVTINQDGTYKYDFSMLDSIDSITEFNLVNLGSLGISGGNGAYYVVGSQSGGSFGDDILITAVQPNGTVNTANDDIGTGSQWIDPKTGLRFDFVTGIQANGSYLDHRSLTGVSIGLADVTATGPGNPQPEADVLLGLYSGSSSTSKGTSILTSANYQSVITSISYQTMNAAGQVVQVQFDTPTEIQAAVAAGQIEFVTGYDTSTKKGGTTYPDSVSGLVVHDVLENTSVAVTTNVAFDAVEAVNYEGFDFSLNSLAAAYVSTEPVNFDLQFVAVDGDGDLSAPASFTITANPVVVGTSGSDQLYGGSGDDLLIGDAGNDVLTGGLGNDVLIGGLGNDSLVGGAGLDTASYADADSAVTVDLSTGLASGGGDADTLSGVENVLGSNYNDTLTGNAEANVLSGGLGDDILSGGGGTDTASYADAAGAVSVNLASGQASGEGADTLSGIENVTGSSYGDTLTGNSGANVLTGGAGNDAMAGDAGNDVLTGGAGNDVMSGGVGSDAFVWTLNDTGSDSITDFNLAPVSSGGDVLDLSELLVGESANAATLDAYLSFSANDAGKTLITVDANAGGAGGTGQTITLENVNFADLQAYVGGAGDTPTDVEIIAKLLADGNLKTDV